MSFHSLSWCVLLVLIVGAEAGLSLMGMKSGSSSTVSCVDAELSRNLNNSLTNLQAELISLRQDVNHDIQSVDTNAVSRVRELNTQISDLLHTQSELHKSQLNQHQTNTESATKQLETSFHQRIDSMDATIFEAKKSTAAQLTEQSLTLEKHAASVAGLLTSQWAQTVDLTTSITEGAVRNISNLQSVLSKSLHDSDTSLLLALKTQDATLSERISTVEGNTQSHQQSHTDLLTALSALNTTTTASMAAIDTKHTVLVESVRQETILRENQHNNINTTLLELSHNIKRLNTEVASQADAYSVTLAEFKTKQSVENEALLVRVEEKLQSTAIHSVQNTIAVQNAVNFTQQLAVVVESANSRVTAMEIQSAALYVQNEHLQQTSQLYREYHTNFTTTILPSVYTQLGAHTTQNQQLQSSVVSIQTEVTDMKVANSMKLQQLTSQVTASENSVKDIISSISALDKKYSESIATLHTQVVSASTQNTVTTAQVTQIEKVVSVVEKDVRLIGAQLVPLSDTPRRLTTLETSHHTLSEKVHTLENSRSVGSNTASNTMDTLTQEIAALTRLVQKQQQELEYVQSENRRLVRETASLASVDELRKLVFDMQTQLIVHSSKVLDVLLQPRSAVVVHTPVCTPADTTTVP